MSSYYLAKLKTNVEEHGPLIQGLVIDIGDIFKKKLLNHTSEPEAARIGIVDQEVIYEIVIKHRTRKKKSTPQIGYINNTDRMEEISVGNILDQAIMHSVFHQYDGRGGRKPKNITSNQTMDYTLNRIFAPILGFSPRVRWTTKFTTTDIAELLQRETRSKKRTELMKRVSKTSTTPLFDSEE